MIKKNLVLSAAFTLLILPVPQANAADKVVCKTAEGEFLVRKRCKQNESVVSVEAFFQTVIAGADGESGLQGPAGEAGAAGVKGATGDIGPQGSLGLENCRVVTAIDTNFAFPSVSSLVAAPTCNSSTEHMLTYGFDSNAAIPPLISNPDQNLRATILASLIFGGSRPIGVEITAKRFVTMSQFALRVNAVCCRLG